MPESNRSRRTVETREDPDLISVDDVEVQALPLRVTS